MPERVSKFITVKLVVRSFNENAVLTLKNTVVVNVEVGCLKDKTSYKNWIWYNKVDTALSENEEILYQGKLVINLVNLQQLDLFLKRPAL